MSGPITIEFRSGKKIWGKKIMNSENTIIPGIPVKIKLLQVPVFQLHPTRSNHISTLPRFNFNHNSILNRYSIYTPFNNLPYSPARWLLPAYN